MVFWNDETAVCKVCHPERSEGSREHKVGVTEILPPYGRLNDTLC